MNIAPGITVIIGSSRMFFLPNASLVCLVVSLFIFIIHLMSLLFSGNCRTDFKL